MTIPNINININIPFVQDSTDNNLPQSRNINTNPIRMTYTTHRIPNNQNTTNQSTNSTTNQSTNFTTNQSTNSTTNQSTNSTTNLPTNAYMARAGLNTTNIPTNSNTNNPSSNRRISISTIPINNIDDLTNPTNFDNLVNSLFQNMTYTNENSYLDETHPTPPPLESLRKNTEVTIFNDSNNTEIGNCSICQDIIKNNDIIRSLKHCKHNFHLDCIDKWFEKNKKCPICRIDITDNNVNILDNNNIDNTQSGYPNNHGNILENS